jgi:hypothetical protein
MALPPLLMNRERVGTIPCDESRSCSRTLRGGLEALQSSRPQAQKGLSTGSKSWTNPKAWTLSVPRRQLCLLYIIYIYYIYALTVGALVGLVVGLVVGGEVWHKHAEPARTRQEELMYQEHHRRLRHHRAGCMREPSLLSSTQTHAGSQGLYPCSKTSRAAYIAPHSDSPVVG